MGLGLILFLQGFFPPLQPHIGFIWACWGFFVLFTIGVYFLADNAAKSTNIHTFSSVVLGVIFIKMVFILMMIVVYKKIANPESLWFVIPFFLIYLVFTIFEVYFMNILGKVKPNKSKTSAVQDEDKRAV